MRRVPSAGLFLTVVLVAGLVAGCTDSPTEVPTSRTVAAPAHIPIALATASTPSGATLTTDKDDYVPGDRLQLVGAGWQAGDVVDLHLDLEPQNHPPVDWAVDVDANGGFTDSSYEVQDSDAGVTFYLTATSRATGESTTATFTDNISTVSITLNSTNVPPALVVAPSASVSMAITATVLSTGPAPNNWNSTGWVLQTSSTAPTGKLANCEDTGNLAGAGMGGATGTRTFNITAPASTGTYNLFLALSDVDGTGSTACGGGGGTDRRGFIGVLSVQTPANNAPTAVPGGPYTSDEGEVIRLDGSGSNDQEDGFNVTYLWSVDVTGNVAPYVAIDAGGECKFYTTSDASDAGTTTSTLQKPYIKCTDDGVFEVTLVVTDQGSPPLSSTPASTQLTVSNVAPDVSMTTPADYSVYAITDAQLGSAGFAGASFTDPGSNDTHTDGLLSTLPQENLCKIDWGEGTVSLGNVTEPSGSTPGSCSSSSIVNPYTDNGAGIYTITVTVIDDDGGSDYDSRNIVVYDPSAGFVTGGGWIMSPAGAYVADAGVIGRANFGFVSKYTKGNNVPTGNTEFQFQAGNLNFHSDTYEWLVVNQNGIMAQFKGNGVINGQGCAADREGKCRFMLWAYDGTKNGGNDTFRIEIWTEDGGGTKHDIYDNGSGAGFSNTPIDGGSIQVQTGGKK